MNQKDKTIKFNILTRVERFNHPYRSFLKIHSTELKYMSPWAQYENNVLSQKAETNNTTKKLKINC